MKNSSAIKMKQSSEVLTDLSGDAVVEISSALRKLLADVSRSTSRPRTSTGT